MFRIVGDDPQDRTLWTVNVDPTEADPTRHRWDAAPDGWRLVDRDDNAATAATPLGSTGGMQGIVLLCVLGLLVVEGVLAWTKSHRT
ncbi:MAG: hypothetical protein QM811_26675 [Pirellulales bacterium]